MLAEPLDCRFVRKTVQSTWEGSNGRALVQDPNGLTDFGKPAETLFERSEASRDGVLEPPYKRDIGQGLHM